MADESYKFSGQAGLSFEELYSSQAVESKLEKAMSQICPCLFYFDGSCKIKADTYGSEEEAENAGEDLKTPCTGAKVRCQYYTSKFDYLTKEYVKDGKAVLAEHIIELFKAYLKYPCSYEVVSTFANEQGVSSYWETDTDPAGHRVVLPRRITVDSDGEILSLPYHPTSLNYGDDLTFVTNEYFKFLFPRMIYPLDITNEFYQGDKVSVLLDVPGNGYTYIIYISELNFSTDILAIIDGFFETGATVRRNAAGKVIRDSNSVLSLDYFFKEMFKKLKSKQDCNLVLECDKIGFGISLATLLSVYDLSKCLIVYSESKLIFSDNLFDLSKIFVGMIGIDNVFGVKLDMSYCDVNFASNCIYDLATTSTLDVSYESSDPLIAPIIHGDYKGQDLSFGASVSIVSKQFGVVSDNEKDISITALPLPWYYSDETTKKYLWALKKEEKEYKFDIERNTFEKEFDLGKITIFKNMIVVCIKNVTFPFYVKSCTYNSYKYRTKYQSYHPMLEYDIDSNFSFLLEQPDDLLQETEIVQRPNPNRGSGAESETQIVTEEVELLKSLPPGVIILVPDIDAYVRDFGSTSKLKFTFVKCGKIEYLPDTSQCRDSDLFIPNECEALEQFSLNGLATGDVCDNVVKVEFKEERPNEDETFISLSNLVKWQLKQKYYVEVTCNLEVDAGTGATYKQADIKTVSYFYFSYLSFKFLFESVSGETTIVEEENAEDYSEEDKVLSRIEKKKEEDDEEEEFDPENSDIQKLLRGERPLTSVDDLNISQEAVEGKGEDRQVAYDFKYLYEKTVRSYINNKFYEPFSIDFLMGVGENSCNVLFTDSVSDFHIAKQLEDAKTPGEPDAPEPLTPVKHNLTHVLNASSIFGLPMCGFNEGKLELNNKYPCEPEESIFDKLVMDNFEHKFDKLFYFYVLGVSKFIQDYIFFVKYKENIIPILKRIPVIVSQVGLPDPEIKYKWKSKCSIYTYSYDTGLNPFTKVVDSENLDFFINPFYVIVHKDYRSDKYEEYGSTDIEKPRVATSDYGFLFTSNWWIKYKQRMDSYGYVFYRGITEPRNIFLDVYRTLAGTDNNDPGGSESLFKENMLKGFAKGKDILYIELEPIDYVYSSYCGDHDFSLDNTTPYLYDRASDFPLSSLFEDPLADNKLVSGIYYTGEYDKHGVGMRRARPYSRFVGSMWFPFRACEVSKYSEFSDYSGVRHFISGESEIYTRSLRGFSCTDLIFKPHNTEDIIFSDFKHLFIDDYFGSINPYRYSSSFYSIDSLNYYEAGVSTEMFQVAPTYLASNASVPWRFTPVLFKDGSDVDSMVVVKPREYIIEPVVSGTAVEVEGVEKYVILDVSNYKDFKVGKTNIEVTKSEQPEAGAKRSILYNCLLDTPPILPYNYNNDKYVCGYERMRGGDANFIYQCLYPYHHVYNYLKGCKCIFDYKNKGEEAYGPIKHTLLPSVINMTTDAEMLISNSVFFPSLLCSMSFFSPCITSFVLFAVDWLNRDVPYVPICRRVTGQYIPIAKEDEIPWVESNYKFWSNYDTLGCETDGPEIMKACLNHCNGIGDAEDFINVIFIDKNSNCCDTKFITPGGNHTVTNLKTKSLYYHFASAWKQAYDYVLLGASMESKPVFYGDGSLRMFKNYNKLKEQYCVFNEGSEVNNIDVLPMFGGLGKFFRICYFSTYYGKVPFSTVSGVNTDPDSTDDDNYVYKLSGHADTDVMFSNNFDYGYLPEKNTVVTVEDISLFISMFSFTEDGVVTLDTRDCVRFGDLVLYEELSDVDNEMSGYYKYKGGDEITIVTFDGEPPVESGPAFVVMYDKSVLTGDKYNYYSDFGLGVSIANPIFGDMGVVVDPFPFGEKIKIKCEPLFYDEGYLNCDIIELRIIGLDCCSSAESPCLIEVKVKEGGSSTPWKFYVESEETVVNTDGQAEVKTIENQKAYLCYDDDYKIGKLVQRDDDYIMSLNDQDVIKKGNTRYKINRGFYIDFEHMFLPHSENTTSCFLQNLNFSNFSTGESWSSSHDCYCVVPGAETALYIELLEACFIIELSGGFFSSRKWTSLTTVGYLCLETGEEFYAVGSLIAHPKYDSAGNNITVGGKYRYGLEFDAYSNYNKVKYCGTKYKLVFNAIFFFCDGYGNRYVSVKYGQFNGGVLGEIIFNKISSLKAITYSKNIGQTVQCDIKSINLYYDNLNDEIMSDDSAFYSMPFGFVYKLKGGILEDKAVKFKEGYDNEFAGQVQAFTFNDREQEFLNRIVLPVEKDVFSLIHYPTCFVRFCLKSVLRDISSETDVNFSTSLVPDLCSIFGYVPISQWVAPGHKLDLYPDSFYGIYKGVDMCNYTYLMKAFACTSCLSIYIDNLDVLSEEATDERQCKCEKLLNWCGITIPDKYTDGDYFVVPFNTLFITHVNHGMFGYPDIVDVSSWITEPYKATVYSVYDEKGNLIQD